MGIPRYKVLLAEDNMICREVAACLLESLGCRVDCVENGSQAVEKADSAAYDAVFLDVIMPIMSGVDAARVIHRRHPDLPLIALTASIDDWTRQACDEAGITAFIPKPIAINELASILSCLDPISRYEPAFALAALA